MTVVKRVQAWGWCWLVALALVWAPVAAAVDTSRGLLWRVESGAATVGYLFGTVHVEDSRVTALPDAVAAAFSASNALALEVVVDAAAVTQITQRMMLPAGEELADRVGAPLAQRAAETARRHGLPDDVARRSKPWALAVTLSTPLPKTGMFLDLQLQRLARIEGKQLDGLEQIAEQLAPFDALSAADARLLLEQTLDQYDEFAAYTDALIRAYLERDLAALERLSREQMGSSAAEKRLMEALVIDRNHRMASRARVLLDRPGVTTFIAVGALHLPGSEGLVNLLSAAGYRLTMEY